MSVVHYYKIQILEEQCMQVKDSLFLAYIMLLRLPKNYSSWHKLVPFLSFKIDCHYSFVSCHKAVSGSAPDVSLPSTFYQLL